VFYEVKDKYLYTQLIGGLNMYSINYDTKTTSATTQYVNLTEQDQQTLFESIMSLNNFIQEVSIAADKDIKSFIKWYVSSNKKYPYNSKLSKYNSPQTIIAGTLNNLMWGTQRDFSLVQLELIQDINNILVDIIEVIITEKHINLQTASKYQKVWCQENLWIS
jgi:hypothetical protein